MQQETLGDRPGASLRVGWVVWWMGQAPTAPSGRKWQRSQSSEGATELGFPGPALGKMHGEAARRAGEPSGHREEPPPQGLGGHQLLVQTDASCPAGQVVRHHLDGQPGSVGGEAARGEMVQSHAVLEVSDGILDLGVAAVVGLQFQGFPVPVGDAAVISVIGEEGQLGTGHRLHPPDDEPHRRGDGLSPEAAQERPQGGWRLDYAAERAGRTASAQRVGVVDAVSAGQSRSHQRHHLVSRVCTSRRIAQVKVLVNEFTQTQVLGQSHRKEQTSIVDQAVVVEGDLDAVGVAAW